jgi:hypothetical protein
MEPEITYSEKAKKKIDIMDALNRINSDKLNEEDIDFIKKRVRDLENGVKERNKPKTITIPGKAHLKIKNYCKNLNLSIGEWCTKVLLEEIEEKSCIFDDERDADEIRESEMKDITDRYINEINRDKVLIKADLLLVNQNLTFKGYSQYDGNPIYEKTGKIDFQDLGIDVKIVKQKEVSLNMSPNYELDIRWF